MTAKPPAHEAFLTTEEVLIRVGRPWRFKKQDIDAWLEGRKAGDEGPRTLLTKMLQRDDDAGYLTKPLRDTDVLAAAARALGAPAA